MRIAILGTGRVAQTLAAALLRTGHDVVFGSWEPGNRTGLAAPVLASADENARNNAERGLSIRIHGLLPTRANTPA